MLLGTIRRRVSTRALVCRGLSLLCHEGSCFGNVKSKGRFRVLFCRRTASALSACTHSRDHTTRSLPREWMRGGCVDACCHRRLRPSVAPFSAPPAPSGSLCLRRQTNASGPFYLPFVSLHAPANFFPTALFCGHLTQLLTTVNVTRCFAHSAYLFPCFSSTSARYKTAFAQRAKSLSQRSVSR